MGNKKVWVNGEVITAEELNRMEEKLEEKSDGGAGAGAVELTQEEYDNLSEEDKMKDVIYFVPDGVTDECPNSDLSWKQLGTADVRNLSLTLPTEYSELLVEFKNPSFTFNFFIINGQTGKFSQGFVGLSGSKFYAIVDITNNVITLDDAVDGGASIMNHNTMKPYMTVYYR